MIDRKPTTMYGYVLAYLARGDQITKVGFNPSCTLAQAWTVVEIDAA